jgi:hypothetical protein
MLNTLQTPDNGTKDEKMDNSGRRCLLLVPWIRLSLILCRVIIHLLLESHTDLHPLGLISYRPIAVSYKVGQFNSRNGHSVRLILCRVIIHLFLESQTDLHPLGLISYRPTSGTRPRVAVALSGD